VSSLDYQMHCHHAHVMCNACVCRRSVYVHGVKGTRIYVVAPSFALHANCKHNLHHYVYHYVYNF
jgi:hypothetical protein